MIAAPNPKRSIESEPPAAGADDSVPLWRFSAPRYWLTWVFVAWLRLSAALPWRMAVKLQRLLGRLACALLPRQRGVVRRNLEICFPQLSQEERAALVTRSLESVSVFLAELGIAWFGARERYAHLFRTEGVEHLEAALARGRGVLLYSGHFTTLEICVPAIKAIVPLYAFMFSERGNRLLNELQRRGRKRAAHVSVVNDDVRALLRLLQHNATVWYAPDQVRVERGELLPFFGEPCMTSTATSRLARITGAAVVPLFFCRTAGDSGYLLRFHEPLDDFPSADVLRDTSRLTAILEAFVRECPDQYFWTHRRFRGRKGLPDAYRD
jgi:KDO2-lipid IV(A) lauroyltransferase